MSPCRIRQGARLDYRLSLAETGGQAAGSGRRQSYVTVGSLSPLRMSGCTSPPRLDEQLGSRRPELITRRLDI
jgi:hypothetical protein